MVEPALLSETLEKLLAFMGAPQVDEVTDLEEAWQEIAGPGTADNVKPTKVLDDVLHLECSAPAWAAQMRWSESQILERYKSKFPDSNVLRIQTKVVLNRP